LVALFRGKKEKKWSILIITIQISTSLMNSF
jgi:hypothetical protein